MINGVNYMKIKILVGVLCSILVFTLTGCQVSSITLNQDQEDFVADYAANRLLQHSYTYNKTLVEVKETETKADKIGEEANSQFNVEKNDNTTETNTELNSPLNQALSLDGFEVMFNGYSIVYSYPESLSEDALFIMTATEGAKILVLKFNIKNISSETISINMQDKGLSYKAYLNNSIEYKEKLTLFLNALNTYSGTFGIGENKELILVYQIAENDAESIKSILLKIDNGIDQYSTSLQ